MLLSITFLFSPPPWVPQCVAFRVPQDLAPYALSVLLPIIPVHVPSEPIKLEIPGYSFNAPQIYPPLSLFPVSEENFPSTLQMKLGTL